MKPLLAALLLSSCAVSAAPVPRPLAVFEGTCIAGNAKASGQVVVLAPEHALIKDEEGNIIELWGSFVCFRVTETAHPDNAPGEKL